MDRRTFIKVGAMAAASLPTLAGADVLHEVRNAAGVLNVNVHGGFAHIFQRRNGRLESLLFGPARAVHGHPHGIRMRIPEAQISRPASNVPFGMTVLTGEHTNTYVWDFTGWDVEFLPDGTTPSAELKVKDEASLQNPTAGADWNSIRHIPDLSALGAGKLRPDFRAHMTSSVLLHGGEITVEPPSENCARAAMLKFDGVSHPVSDVFNYRTAMNGSLVLRVAGSGIQETVTLVPKTPGSLTLTIDFPIISDKLYTQNEPLHHYADLSALGDGGTVIPTYDQRNKCLGQGSPGKYCPGARYSRDI